MLNVNADNRGTRRPRKMILIILALILIVIVVILVLHILPSGDDTGNSPITDAPEIEEVELQAEEVQNRLSLYKLSEKLFHACIRKSRVTAKVRGMTVFLRHMERFSLNEFSMCR